MISEQAYISKKRKNIFELSGNIHKKAKKGKLSFKNRQHKISKKNNKNIKNNNNNTNEKVIENSLIASVKSSKSKDLKNKKIKNIKKYDSFSEPTPLTSSRLSKRALEVQKEEFFLTKGMGIVRDNKYHPETNPNGIINLGTAENRLNNTELLKKINTPESTTVKAEHFLYGPYNGSDKLREEIADLLNRHFHPKVALTKDNLCVGNGCGSLLNLYGDILFDQGDAVLVPGPYYGGFDADIKYGAGVHCVPVPHTADDCLKVTEEALETALKNATRPVRGIVIANPNNPFGRSYSAKQLLLFCNFAKSHGLIVLCDEIYGLSTWNDIVNENIEEGKTLDDYYCHCDRCRDAKNIKKKETGIKRKNKNIKFTSIYSLDLPDPDNTHCLWGFSKDFCLNGLRVGAIVTYSKTVMAAIQKLCLITCISTTVDNILVKMLSDHEWADAFIINNNRKLFKNYSHLINFLKTHGIPYIEGESGFFIYIDLHQGGIDEYDLWMKLLEGGVYISPSQAFFSENTKEERNWFRICFAVEQNELNLSLDRIFKVLNSIKN